MVDALSIDIGAFDDEQLCDIPMALPSARTGAFYHAQRADELSR